MNISIDDIKHIAKLSKLYFEQSELNNYLVDLNSIIDYVNKLSEIDLTGIVPTSHAGVRNNVFREDVVQTSMSTEELLKNAADIQEDCFHVPQVVEGY